MFPICSLVAWNKPSVILALLCCLNPPCLILHETRHMVWVVCRLIFFDTSCSSPISDWQTQRDAH